MERAFRFFLFSLTLTGFGVHQSFAADANGYTALYEVDVSADVQRACDQLVQPADSWSSIAWSNDVNGDGHIVICLVAGDHTAKGALDTAAGG